MLLPLQSSISTTLLWSERWKRHTDVKSFSTSEPEDVYGNGRASHPYLPSAGIPPLAFSFPSHLLSCHVPKDNKNFRTKDPSVHINGTAFISEGAVYCPEYRMQNSHVHHPQCYLQYTLQTHKHSLPELQ